jgi:hypothetical protein
LYQNKSAGYVPRQYNRQRGWRNFLSNEDTPLLAAGFFIK